MKIYLTETQRKFLEHARYIQPWKDIYELNINCILQDGCYHESDRDILNELNNTYMSNHGIYVIINNQIATDGKSIPTFAKND